MTESLTAKSTPKLDTEQALMFQTPPTIGAWVTPEEHAATEGPAKSHARGLSARAATLAGIIAGAVVGAVMVGKNASQRVLKTAGIAISGGIIGNIISAMPWVSKQPVEPVQQNHPITLPNLPQVPTPQPTPHPAAPGTAIAEAETAGRMETAAPAASISA